MEESGIARAIREEEGNEKYDYFQSVRDPETVLLIDQWRDQTALDAHHATPMMQQLAALRDKYNLHMRVERYRDAEENPADEAFAPLTERIPVAFDYKKEYREYYLPGKNRQWWIFR